MLEDQPKPPHRKKARNCTCYTKEEFVEWYSDELGHDRWADADPADDQEQDTTNIHSVLGRALWPRDTPKIMMVEGKDILLAAATCPPAAVIEDLFKALLRVRQAEFESEVGVEDPDAWDTGAGEPSVAINVDRHLSDQEFGKALGRWRKQWASRITLLPHQEEQRRTLSHSAFGTTSTGMARGLSQ